MNIKQKKTDCFYASFVCIESVILMADETLESIMILVWVVERVSERFNVMTVTAVFYGSSSSRNWYLSYI